MALSSRRRLLLVAVIAGFGTFASAAEPAWPVARGPSHEPVPFRYDPVQWKKVPRDFLDDAPACLLYSGVSYLVEADGTIETITHEITRLNSRKALQDLGEYRSIVYNPAYERLTLNEAQVCKADGRCVPVSARHVQLRDMGTDFQVYDTSKQLVISFPSLEVGDVIEVKWTTRGKNPEHRGHFFTRYTFGADTYPIVCDEIRVRLPKERTLKYRVTGGTLEPEVREEGTARTYHWKGVNLKQLPLDDHLPSKEDLRLQVACSTFTTWDQVLEWKQNLRKDCWRCTPDVRQVVQDVTRGLKTPLEKARALTYWVRRHVRYVSVGEKHDYTPHTPTVVLANRFGDCKDTTQLLAVMLKEAGVPAALATLGIRDDGQVLEDVPSPWGTHAILLTTIDGVDHWIDTTASLSGWDVLPRDDHDRLCYVVDDFLRLKRTPKLTPEDNRTEQTTRLTIGADGSARAERSATYYNLAALARRNDWMDVPVGERRRQLAAELQDANSKTRLCALNIDEAALRAYDQPVKARICYEVQDQFTEDPDRPRIREGNITDSRVWSGLLWVNIDFDRTLALELDTPFESIHRYVIQVPPYFKLDTKPSDKDVESPWGAFHLRVKEDKDDPHRIEIEYHTRVDKIRIEPADFDAFRKFHDDVLKQYRVWLSLAPAKDLAGAPLLEALLRLAPGDQACAIALADLYLNNQRKDDARRVLQLARKQHPANSRLAELAIKAAEGLQEEEAIYRKLIRHAPRELKYQLALGQNLVEQDRHADAKGVLQPVTQNGSASQQSLAYYLLARSSLMRDQGANALRNFQKAEDADADTVSTVAALRLKASIFEKLDQSADAIETYRELLEIDAETPDALDALVRLELATGNKTEALTYLRRYSLAARDEAALARAASYHLRLDRYEDAFDLASRAREQGGGSLAQRVLGLVYLQRGDFEKAAFHLERADVDGPVLEGLIRSRLALGQLVRAGQDAEQIEKLGKASDALMPLCQRVRELVRRRTALLDALKPPPEKRDQWADAVDHLICAEYAWTAGRPAAAVETLLNAALSNGVELGAAFGLRGLLALDKGRLLRALSDAEHAVKTSPQEPIGYFVRGRVRLERGQAEALADLKKAVELSERKDAGCLHWLATALYQDGHKMEALAVQREAVKLKPRDAELAQQLQDFEQEVKK